MIAALTRPGHGTHGDFNLHNEMQHKYYGKVYMKVFAFFKCEKFGSSSKY